MPCRRLFSKVGSPVEPMKGARSMSSHVLAIDQGTTGTTVLLLDHDGQAVGRAYSEFKQIYPRPGWVEHDPEEIWEVTCSVIEKALREAGIPPDRIAAIGITNQRETTVLWDRTTGKPVHNAIVWQCRRTAPICNELRDQGRENWFRERTGLVLDAYFSGTKLLWLLDNVPDARNRAEQGELLFGTIDTWLIWKLSGGRAHVTDYTNASRTLALQHLRQGMGRGHPRPARHPGRPPSRGEAVERCVCPHGRSSPSSCRDPDRRERRGPAGRPVRAGGLGARNGQEHLRHRLLPPDVHRRQGRSIDPGTPDHPGLLRNRWAGLCTGGVDLHGGRGRSVAARRTRGPGAGRRERADGQERPGQPRGLHGARLRRPGSALLGHGGKRSRSSA